MPINKRSRIRNLESKSSIDGSEDLKINKSTQTSSFGESQKLSSIQKFVNVGTVADMFSILMDHCGIINSVQIRVLSVTVYMLLRLLNIPFSQARQLLSDLRLTNAQACHEWVETIIDEDDLCVILRDRRGGHKLISFYEGLPELEAEAKAFAIEKASAKHGYWIFEHFRMYNFFNSLLFFFK